MAAHSYEVAPGHTLRASFDQSTSTDKDNWVWEEDEASYTHYRLAYQTSLEGFDLEVAAEDTDIDKSSFGDTADARIVASVSRSFGL